MSAGVIVRALAIAALALAPTMAVAASQDSAARGLAARALAEADTRAANDRLKRAAQRAAAANPESADRAAGVTLTVTAAADPALTRVYAAGPNAALFATTGGRATAAGGAGGNQYLYFPVSSVAPATNGNLSGALTATPDRSAWGWTASFDTDSDRVEVRLGTCATCRFRFRVDGRYVDRVATAGIDYVAYAVLDFAGERRPRTITVEGSDTNSLRGVAVRATSNIWRPAADPDRIVALATGDSYSEGQGASSPGLFAWPQVLGRLMGWSDVRQVAVGGTGYLNPAAGLGRSRLSAQIARWLPVNDDLAPGDVDVVTVAAGYNDHPAIGGVTHSPEAIAAEAVADWRAIRTLLPRAMIVVLGPHAGARGPDARTLAIETALATRFAAWKDANALWVPVAGASGGTPWIFGTGRIGAANDSGNSDVMIAPDGVHPSDAGHALYARRAAAVIRAALAGR